MNPCIKSLEKRTLFVSKNDRIPYSCTNQHSNIHIKPNFNAMVFCSFLSRNIGDWSWGVPQPHQENAVLRLVDGEMHQNKPPSGRLRSGHFLRIAPRPLAEPAELCHRGQSDGNALLAHPGHDLSGPVERRGSGLCASNYPVGTIHSVNGKYPISDSWRMGGPWTLRLNLSANEWAGRNSESTVRNYDLF